MSNVLIPLARECAEHNGEAPDTTQPATPTRVSPAPIPHRENGSGAPPFMLPAYRRRRNVGRSYY
jgi:hypothetical protein